MLVQDVIGQAAADPANAAAIFQQAAKQFHNLALVPENERLRPILRRMSAEMAAASWQGNPTPLPEAAEGQRATKDDFEELEDQHAAAMEEVGQHGDFEVMARRAEIQEASKVETSVARVATNPASFNERTPLGRTATVKFNPSNTDQAANIVATSTVLLWQGDKVETQAATVDISVNEVFPDPTGIATCRPYAIVTYGSDGNRTSVAVDVGRGTRLTVVGNYVDVLVGMDQPPAGFNSGVMTLGASLGMHAARSIAPITRTVYVDNLAVGGVVTYPRPSHATSILSPQSTDTAGTMRLRFYDTGGLLVYALIFGAGSITSPIPLTGDVATIDFTNQGTLAIWARIPHLLAL